MPVLLPGESVVLPRQEHEPEWVRETRHRDLYVEGDPNCPHDFPRMKTTSGDYEVSGSEKHFGAFITFESRCRLCPAVVGRRLDIIFEDIEA